jgi:hypothetical protein
MFKLKDFDCESDKIAAMNRIKSGLESLQEKIPVLRKIQVEFNVNPDEEYDLVLIAEFNNLNDLEIYTKHPEHVKVSAFIAENRVKRACVDYEF